MKKIIGSRVFSFMLGAILFSSVAVYATSTLLSRNVTFTPENSNWNVSNVEDALNDLYNSTNQNEELILTFNPGTNVSSFNKFDMRIFLEQYQNKYKYFMVTEAVADPVVATKCSGIYMSSMWDQTTGNTFANTEYLVSDYNQLYIYLSGNSGCFFRIKIKLYN